MNCIESFRVKKLVDVPIPHGNDLVRFMGKMPVTGYSNDFVNESLNGPEVLANGARLLNNDMVRNARSEPAPDSAAKPDASKTEGNSSEA